MLLDAHLHITKNDVKNNLLNLMDTEDMYALAAGTYPEECAYIAALSQCQRRIIPTFGLHPWYADQYDINGMEPYLNNCPVIGEIGMDSVWCKTDLAIQRKIFISQLNIAEERKCPVILHTKGQEKEIGEIISDYSIPVLIHWYSCENYLDFYIERDCYFTVGPDVFWNHPVQQVVKQVSLNRLFVESDGISAVEWAQGLKITTADLSSVLKNSISYISEIKEMTYSDVTLQMQLNLKKLIQYDIK